MATKRADVFGLPGKDRSPGNESEPTPDNRTGRAAIRGDGGSSGGSPGGSGSSGSGDSGDTPTFTGEAGPQTDTPAYIRIEDYQEYDNFPKPDKRSETTPRKPTKVTLTDRKSAAKAVAAEVCDAANAGAMFITRAAVVKMGDDLLSANMTDEEYGKISAALANLLAPYDWITKVKTGSDVGTLLLASAGWAMRVVMIYNITHPKAEGPQPQRRAFPNPFQRKAASSAPDKVEVPPNGMPTPLDFESTGLRAFGEDVAL